MRLLMGFVPIPAFKSVKVCTIYIQYPFANIGIVWYSIWMYEAIAWSTLPSRWRPWLWTKPSPSLPFPGPYCEWFQRRIVESWCPFLQVLLGIGDGKTGLLSNLHVFQIHRLVLSGDTNEKIWKPKFGRLVVTWNCERKLSAWIRQLKKSNLQPWIIIFELDHIWCTFANLYNLDARIRMLSMYLYQMSLVAFASFGRFRWSWTQRQETHSKIVQQTSWHNGFGPSMWLRFVDGVSKQWLVQACSIMQ